MSARENKGADDGDHDRFNLGSAVSGAGVDDLNRAFYGRFNFPWPPATFESFPDQRFAVRNLNQDLGDWSHQRIPAAPKIWVAGCGTNQAVYTALRFPGSDVLGTDISTQSLAVCQRSAEQVGADRLSLREGSIRSADFENEFDYVMCTGVIHHNAVPREPLAALARALKPNGVLELMVYNYYHRLHTTAYQNAIRLLSGAPHDQPDHDTELVLTRATLGGIDGCPSMSTFLQAQQATTEAELADSLLQPVEYSYTVESLNQLAESCGLEMILPCANQFDKSEDRLSWTLAVDEPGWQERYEALADVDRWQLANLLKLEASPMLWFTFQRKKTSRPRRAEREILDSFLDTRFAKHATVINRFVRDPDRGYVAQGQRESFPVPSAPADSLARRIFANVDPAKPLREAFRSAEVDPTLCNVSRARVHLATTLFPYLKALP